MALVETELNPARTIFGTALGDAAVRVAQIGDYTWSESDASSFLGTDLKALAPEQAIFLRYEIDGIPDGATITRAKFRAISSAAPVVDGAAGYFRVGMLNKDGKWDSPISFGWNHNVYSKSSELPFPTASGSDALIGGKLVLDLWAGEVPYDPVGWASGETNTFGDSLYNPDYGFSTNTLGWFLNVWRANIDRDQCAFVLDPYQLPVGVAERLVLYLEDAGAGSGPALLVEYDQNPPTITSSPPLEETLGLEYRYDVEATDPTGQTIGYTLETYPAGATIDPASGLVEWMPTAVGSFDFVVRATDSDSFYDEQPWTVAVTSPGVVVATTELAPNPSANPVTVARVDVLAILAAASVLANSETTSRVDAEVGDLAARVFAKGRLWPRE